MLSAIQAVPEFFSKFRDKIFAGSNSLLMCTLYYVYYDHGFPKSAMALSKVSIDAKHISYLREGIKAVIEKLVETSVTNGLDKKAEWANQVKEVEDKDLKQAMKNALNNTKGKHGRRTLKQEEVSIDDILIADDKQALKEAILKALNDMGKSYDTAFIKEALICSKHLDEHIKFAVFLRAISTLSGKEYKYEQAQDVDSFIYHNKKQFYTSKISKWQRGRRIVDYWKDIFYAIK